MMAFILGVLLVDMNYLATYARNQPIPVSKIMSNAFVDDHHGSALASTWQASTKNKHPGAVQIFTSAPKKLWAHLFAQIRIQVIDANAGFRYHFQDSLLLCGHGLLPVMLAVRSPVPREKSRERLNLFTRAPSQ